MASEYLYDTKGNMVADLNKGINPITYNQLNLPLAIASIITYRYDGSGVKMQKALSGRSTIDYLWGYQYKDGVLQFFPTAEGYVQNTVDEDGIDNFNYVYNYMDHLGNIRMSYSMDSNGLARIMEENNYYPFGLKHENYNWTQQDYINGEQGTVIIGTPKFVEGYSAYNYKYQGQERQDEFGLNWDSFKWRNYDYAIGRFMSVDPLAEKYAYNSTYAFQENKMGMGRELEGLELVNNHKDKQKIYDSSGNNGQGDFTKYATEEDRALIASLLKTEAGRAQFKKLVESDVPTTAKMDKESAPKEGNALILGETVPIGKKGIAVKNEKGEMIGIKPAGFDITLYEKNINATVGIATKGSAAMYGKRFAKDASFSDILGAAFGHEIEHATPKDLLYGTLHPDNVEELAKKVSDQIIDQLNGKK